jgi:hypothetical protein
MHFERPFPVNGMANHTHKGGDAASPGKKNQVFSVDERLVVKGA